MNIPKIDPNVVHISLGQFRRSAAEGLSQRTYVVNDGDDPLAVCVPFAVFLELQRVIEETAWARPSPEQPPGLAGESV